MSQNIGSTAFLGTGSTVTWTGFTGKIIEITPPSLSRPTVKASHMASEDWDEFIPGAIVNGGELEMRVEWLGELPTQLTAQTVDDITIKFGDGSSPNATWSFKGFITQFSPGAPFEDRMTANIKIQVADAIEGLTAIEPAV